MTYEAVNSISTERSYDTADEVERVACAVRALVAKTAPDDAQLWLPLLIHLRDTAAVMEYLTARWLPEQYCVSLGLHREEFFRLAIRAALLHDIGKPEAQCRGKREGDPDMHYYGHPEKSMEIVRDIVIQELDRQGYVIPCFDVQELLYYVKYHDDHVSVKLKHVRRHTKMASFAMFQNLMMLQTADAKAHIQIPIIAERAEICERLAGEEGRLLYQRILDGE